MMQPAGNDQSLTLYCIWRAWVTVDRAGTQKQKKKPGMNRMPVPYVGDGAAD